MIYIQLSIIYLILFINDIIIFKNDKILIEKIKIKFFFHFKIKNLEIMKYFLELKIEYNSYENIIISQKYYIKYILE